MDEKEELDLENNTSIHWNLRGYLVPCRKYLLSEYSQEVLRVDYFKNNVIGMDPTAKDNI